MRNVLNKGRGNLRHYITAQGASGSDLVVLKADDEDCRRQCFAGTLGGSRA